MTRIGLGISLMACLSSSVGIGRAQQNVPSIEVPPVLIGDRNGWGNPVVPKGGSVTVKNSSTSPVSLHLSPAQSYVFSTIGFIEPWNTTGQSAWGTPWGYDGASYSWYTTGGSAGNQVRKWSTNIVVAPGQFIVGALTVGLRASDGSTVGQDIAALHDNRTDAQRADAPKISIGVPLSDLGYLASLQVGNDRAVILAAGLISDPGYPINPNGLELQYDENGVRKSVTIHVGPDGRFSGFAMANLGVNGTGGRALLIYHRTSGDEVNVGYYGDSAMFERRKEIKSLGRDSLRNIINEAVKNTGHFRWRSNGVVMGVRG